MQISKKLPRFDDHIQLGLLDRISNFLIFVFAFINFLSLISFSSLSIAHPSIGIEVSRLFKITIIIFAISSFFLPKTPKQLIYWTVGIFFIIIDYRTNDNLTFFLRTTTFRSICRIVKNKLQKSFKIIFILNTTRDMLNNFSKYYKLSPN
ncbi:hypothetical protein AAX20_04895 [Oenococcus oeni]|nr:hypothetical protein AAX20_04895 [Oenococcus oeni]